MALRDDIAASLRRGIADLIEGAAGDLEGFLSEIASYSDTVLATGDASLIDELGEQVEALGKRHRIRAAATGWQIVSNVVMSILMAAAGGMRSVGGAA